MNKRELFRFWRLQSGVTFSHTTEQKLWSFRFLKEGWHLGEGVVFTENAVQEALHIHSQILAAGFTQTDVFPGLCGEIMLTVYSGDEYFEFTLEPDGKWTFNHEHINDDIEAIPNLTLKEAQTTVAELQNKICATSEFYHASIGTPDGKSLRASPSSLQATMMGSPLLRHRALSNSQGRYAITSESTNIMRRLQANRLYFGSFQVMISPENLDSPKMALTTTRAIDLCSD